MRSAALVVATLVLLGGCLGGFGADLTTNVAEDSSDDPSEVDGDLEVHHIDVGQADSTLIVGPSGETMLIDTGDWRDDGETVIEYLESQGVDRIDHLVTTHGHADHIGGHAAVIDHFEVHGEGVGAVYDPGTAHTSDTYDRYLDAVERHEVTLFEVREGDEISFEGVETTVLNPVDGEHERMDEIDYNSVALSLEFGAFTYLTTGDADANAEQRIGETWGDDLEADVYQAGHHGSSTSSTPPFVERVSPEIAVISSAVDSQYGHPHDEVLEAFADRGVETYWTGVHGNIVVTTDGDTTTVDSEIDATTDPEGLLERKADHVAETLAVVRPPIDVRLAPMDTR